MRRGDVYLVDLGIPQGSEARSLRPAVVVSNDAANASAVRRGRGVVTVVPLTSNVEHVYPFQVLLAEDATGLSRASKAQAEQVRSVDISRLARRVGELPAPSLRAVDDALRLHLGL